MQRTLIYENSLAGDQAGWERELAEDWLLEGKGICTRSDCLSMRSEIFTVPRHEDGHFNLWLRREFPADVAISFDFRFSEPGDQGLAIAMWAARGRQGTTIFDPSLPQRLGERMEDMHSGAIDCYHTSYIARGRHVANLRKNHGFHLVASGPDLSQVAQPETWHRIEILHLGPTITLSFDDRPTLTWTDDGTIGGPAHRQGGAFGFRQQNNLHRGDYRDLCVHALIPG